MPRQRAQRTPLFKNDALERNPRLTFHGRGGSGGLIEVDENRPGYHLLAD